MVRMMCRLIRGMFKTNVVPQVEELKSPPTDPYEFASSGLHDSKERDGKFFHTFITFQKEAAFDCVTSSSSGSISILNGEPSGPTSNTW